MIDRFADWFAGVLLEKGVITEDELEVQVYGIQTILSNLLSYGVVLAVSWAFGVLPLSAVFLAVYTVLRKTVGGWHAKTPFSCALSSIAVWGAGLLLAAVAAKSAALLFVAWAAGCLALWCKAPCIMPDEEDTLELRRKLRLRTAVVCAVVLGAALLSMWLIARLCAAVRLLLWRACPLWPLRCWLGYMPAEMKKNKIRERPGALLTAVFSSGFDSDFTPLQSIFTQKRLK